MLVMPLLAILVRTADTSRDVAAKPSRQTNSWPVREQTFLDDTGKGWNEKLFLFGWTERDWSKHIQQLSCSIGNLRSRITSSYIIFMLISEWLHSAILMVHYDVIKWKHFPRYWTFVRGTHRSPVNSAEKGQWRGALMFSLICAWTKGWVNNRDSGDLRRHRAHYDIIVMWYWCWFNQGHDT